MTLLENPASSTDRFTAPQRSAALRGAAPASGFGVGLGFPGGSGIAADKAAEEQDGNSADSPSGSFAKTWSALSYQVPH